MTPFKIAAAQVPSIRGDVERNLATHAEAMRGAARQGVSVLVFPELSLTGYEPDLAAKLAMTSADPRLSSLLALAREHRLETVVGAPLHNNAGKPAIGAILFGAQGTAREYRKMHLGTSEQPWFAAGESPLSLNVSDHTVGIAICADSSQPSHPLAYADLGADIYATGVLLNAEWYDTDVPRLAAYAARYRMLVLMANHAASVGTYTSVGKSAVWGPEGQLLAQAAGTENALVIATRSNSGWSAEVVGI